MKDKISKIISLIKKYGLLETIKKLLNYISSKIISLFNSLNFIKNKKMNKLLDKILNSDYDRVILWRSNFGWNVPLFQRPQHISLNLSKQKCLVFYEVTRFTDKVNDLRQINENLVLVNFENSKISKMLFSKLENVKKPKYVQIYSTDWNMRLDEMKKYISNGFKIIYEYIDEINPILTGTKEIPVNVKEKYEYVLQDKDNVFVVVTADRLEQDVIQKRGNKNLVFACNGVDYEHYTHIDDNFEFDDDFREILLQKKPIIGYYGAMAIWFDYELIRNLAMTKPNYNIVLIGSKYDDSLEKSKIEELKNVYFLGTRNYNVLQNYANCFNVCTVPFLINDITKSTSPLKIFEYMALGKPIVTTAMDECKKYKSIYIANNAEEFIQMVDKALTLNKNKDKEYYDTLKKEAIQNTWHNKTLQIINGLKNIE